MRVPSLPPLGIGSRWTDLTARLPPGLDLNQSARSSGALRRRRNVQDAETLLRLALAHGPGALSLRSAAAWAGLTGIAQLSDVALRRRLRGAADWLGHIAGALLSQGSATAEALPTSRLRIVDGTSISRAGDDGTTWRIHASFDPATACFTDLQLTGADEGEGFSRFSFARGDLAIGDRFYAKPPGLQHVLRSGADFLVRVGWNSMRMVTAGGARLDLSSMSARFLMVLTSLPAEKATAAEALAAYRLRWQVEFAQEA